LAPDKTLKTKKRYGKDGKLEEICTGEYIPKVSRKEVPPYIEKIYNMITFEPNAAVF
jgi:hypothetical protein